MTRKDFPRRIKIDCLLWSDRHCCLCGKQCAMDIEIAHIDRKGKAVPDNAIPLCYDCHAKIGHYHDEEPRGNKYQPSELRSRRDQIYQRYTSYLVPGIDFQVLETNFPDVGFRLKHLGGPFPVRLKVKVEVILGNKNLGVLRDQYDGQHLWNLNPGYAFKGHINLPKETAEKREERLELDTTITIVDVYGCEHVLLPMAHIYDRVNGGWIAEPCPFVDRRRHFNCTSSP